MGRHTDIQFCYNCFCKSGERRLYSYSLHDETQIIFRMESIDLCFLCKRQAQMAESFIENVKSNQLLLSHFDKMNELILETLSQEVSRKKNLTKCILKGVELTGDELFDDDNPFTIVYGPENYADIKLELEPKKEDVKKIRNFDDDFLPDNDQDLDEEDYKPLKILKEELELEGIKIKCLRQSSKKIKETKRKKNTQKLLDLITEGIKIEMVSITREQCMEELARLRKDEKYVLSLYKCEDCVKGFSYRHTFNKHMERHSQANGDYECDICKQRTASVEKLNNHKRHHFVRYKCVECGLTRIAKLSIIKHYHSTHVPDKSVYSCGYCPKKFDSEAKLKRHVLGVHSNKEKVICDHCHKSYSHKVNLRTHLAMRHPSEISLFKIKQVCQVCGKGFTTPSHLRNHMIKHTQARDYYCVECDKSFKSETTLKHHVKTTMSHASYSDLPLPCSQCDKRFAIRRDLDLHMNRMHLNIKPFQCEQCDKAYVTSWGLNDHRRMIHEGYKPPPKYSCPTCNKAFTRSHILKSHIRTHTGDRPYRCSACPARFGQAGVLSTHFKLVHLKLTRDGRPKPTPNGGLKRRSRKSDDSDKT